MNERNRIWLAMYAVAEGCINMVLARKKAMRLFRIGE